MFSWKRKWPWSCINALVSGARALRGGLPLLPAGGARVEVARDLARLSDGACGIELTAGPFGRPVLRRAPRRLRWRRARNFCAGFPWLSFRKVIFSPDHVGGTGERFPLLRPTSNWEGKFFPGAGIFHPAWAFAAPPWKGRAPRSWHVGTQGAGRGNPGLPACNPGSCPWDRSRAPGWHPSHRCFSIPVRCNHRGSEKAVFAATDHRCRPR